jgi:tetratricopeptide (TPR) repeat protein
VKYARSHQDEYSAVIWIDGSSRDRLQQSFLDAAKRIPREQLQVDVAAALGSVRVDIEAVMRGVLQWLSLPGNRKWLLVIDNVDREFRGPGKDGQGFDPKEATPDSDHGSILITSRLSNLQGIGETLPLGRVNECEAKEILERQAGRLLQGWSLAPIPRLLYECTRALTYLTDVHLLITKLNGLPLALTQAGAFISRTGIDVQTYIDYFDRTWSNLIEKQDRFPLQEYGERSMLTTWKLSYDQVLRQSEAAAWLLRLWAFFFHDDFWYGLLEKGTTLVTREIEAPAWLVKLTGSSLEFSSAMGLLRAYSLADSPGAGSYSMHSVLHQWSRSLSLDADAASLLSVSVCALGNAAPSNDDEEYWKLDRRLLQHVLQSLNELRVLQTLAQQEPPPWAMHNLGNMLRRQGKLDETEWMYQRALAGYEKSLGPDHTLTLNTVNNLGLLYSDQGKLDEAETMYKRALAGYEKALGPDHTSTLDTVNNLGTLYSAQGKLDKAETMYKRALAGNEKALGPDHTSTLATVHNLGSLYSDQGKLDEAERMYRRALLVYQRIYGPSHDRVTATSAKLASIRSKKGCFLVCHFIPLTFPLTISRSSSRHRVTIRHCISTHRASHYWRKVPCKRTTQEAERHCSIHFQMTVSGLCATTILRVPWSSLSPAHLFHVIVTYPNLCLKSWDVTSQHAVRRQSRPPVRQSNPVSAAWPRSELSANQA